MVVTFNMLECHLCTWQHELLLMIYVHLGTKVIEVKASDADDPSTANGELRYSLIQDNTPFEIDSITGT